MSDTTSDTNNPVHVAFCSGIVVAAIGLVVLGSISGAEWVSTVTWMAGILVLGKAVGVVATGFTVVAQAKAAQTLQTMKDKA